MAATSGERPAVDVQAGAVAAGVQQALQQQNQGGIDQQPDPGAGR